MAVKTITIDLEAYALLSRQKREGQSFSQVIKAHFGPQPTAGRFLGRIRSVRFSDDALSAMDMVVKSRVKNPLRIPQL
jgi:predicted CopG family antitoxin